MRTIETGDGDDRQNHVTRGRMDELAESWNAAVTRLDRRYARVLRLCLAVLVIALMMIGFYVLLLRRVNENATRNTAALCALRHDLEHRVQAGQRFLTKHPAGAFGFSRADIVTNLTNQRRTITALSAVQCD